MPDTLDDDVSAPLDEGGRTAVAMIARSAVELLGLVAQLEHLTFARLADDAAAAPTVAYRLTVSRYAAAAVGRRDRVLTHLTALGADAERAMVGYDGVLADLDERVVASTWWERLLTEHITYGVAVDFCRLLAAAADPATRGLLTDVLGDTRADELTVAHLSRALADDDVLAARLALWGRRVVGEVLGAVQRLAARPGLAQLAAAAELASDGRTRLLGQLTAEHTRRMTRLGLTA